MSVPSHLSRRSMLARLASAAAAATGSGALLGVHSIAVAVSQSAPDSGGESTPNPISLAQWSLHRSIQDGKVDPLDFPRAARRFGIAAVEYVNTFYRPLLGRSDWATELRRRADGEGVRSLLIMCDGEGELGAPEPSERRATVERHERWLEAASVLGCHSIRVNARSAGSPEVQTERLVDGLGALADRARSRGLSVLVENHGGQSSDGEWLARTLRAVGRENLGSLPDFGNFRVNAREWRDRYAGVEALMPMARAVSAKSYDFDADGNETSIDYPRMLAIVRRSGYRGHVGIEYEGRRQSEEEGIRATHRLLVRCGCAG